MIEPKFYICRKCGNLVGMIEASGVIMKCCGEPMEELIPGTVDASLEKHLPVVEVNGNEITVTVGSVIHPMTEEHHIAWIYLLTENGGQRKVLEHTGEPVAKFILAEGEKPVAAYEYCNLHGLWKTDIQ